MLKNMSVNHRKFMGGDSIVSCQFDWIKPKLTFTLRGAHMDMRRFVPFIRIKMESVFSDS